MAKQRSVVSVHIDIAALVWATRGLNSDLEWAIWARSFVEALATQAPDKNQFAAQLIGDVLDFREKEAERIRNLRNVHVQAVQDDVQTESKKESQSVSKSESQKESNKEEQPKSAPRPSFQDHPWFDDSGFSEAWEAWGRERKKRGTERSFGSLRKLSGDSLAVAVQILNQSADNGWQGLFALKDSRNQGTQKPASRESQKAKEYDEQLTL